MTQHRMEVRVSDMSDGVFIILMGAMLAAWLVVNALRIRAQGRRRRALFMEQYRALEKPAPPAEGEAK